MIGLLCGYACAQGEPQPPSAELKRRLAVQQSAVRSGSADAIIGGSRTVVALALRQMAQWRLRYGAVPQAIVLCRQSLLIEDSAGTKAVLTTAETAAVKQQLALPQNLNSVDPTVLPSTPELTKAKLTASEIQQGRAQEKRLRRVLSTAYNDWGTAEAHQEQFLSAMVHFQEAESWDASTPGLMRNIGLAASKVGDHREAVRALKIAVEKDPKDRGARSMLGVSLFALGDFAGAAKAFGQVGDSIQADPEMAYAWAFSLSRTNDLKQAKVVLDRMSSEPLPADMLILVGKLYNDVGDYMHALSCFQGAARQDATIKQAHGGAGVALIHLSRPAEAVPELEAELKVNPGDPDTQYQLAYALLQLSKTDQAIPILRTLIAAHPDHARARYQLGKALLDARQMDEAIQNLQAAAELDPERAYIHYQLQMAYRQTGNAEAADRELKLYQELKARDRQRITIDSESEMPSENRSDR